VWLPVDRPKKYAEQFLVIFNLVTLEGWGRDEGLRSKEGNASMPQLVLGFKGLREKMVKNVTKIFICALIMQ
jgi:hypothetical protein